MREYRTLSLQLAQLAVDFNVLGDLIALTVGSETLLSAVFLLLVPTQVSWLALEAGC